MPIKIITVGRTASPTIVQKFRKIAPALGLNRLHALAKDGCVGWGATAVDAELGDAGGVDVCSFIEVLLKVC